VERLERRGIYTWVGAWMPPTRRSLSRHDLGIGGPAARLSTNHLPSAVTSHLEGGCEVHEYKGHSLPILQGTPIRAFSI
jgi:hypothetical protein